MYFEPLHKRPFQQFDNIHGSTDDSSSSLQNEAIRARVEMRNESHHIVHKWFAAYENDVHLRFASLLCRLLRSPLSGLSLVTTCTALPHRVPSRNSVRREIR